MRKWDANIICLVGLILGIIALFLPWHAPTSTDFGELLVPTETPLDAFLGFNHYKTISVDAPMLIFLIAVLMAFITPLAGPILLMGASIALIHISEYEYTSLFPRTGPGRDIAELTWPTMMPGPGLWMAFSAAVITIIGLLLPLGYSSKVHRSDISARLLTIRPRDFWRSKINLLCTIGLMISLLSLMLPWGSVVVDHPISPTTIFLDYPSHYLTGSPDQDAYSITNLSGVSYAIIAACMLLFLAGVMVSAISPIGGLLQLMGASAYLWILNGISGDRVVVDDSLLLADFHWVGYLICHANIGPGSILGLIGAIVVTSSMIWPASIHHRSAPANLSERLLTWGRLEDSGH